MKCPFSLALARWFVVAAALLSAACGSSGSDPLTDVETSAALARQAPTPAPEAGVLEGGSEQHPATPPAVGPGPTPAATPDFEVGDWKPDGFGVEQTAIGNAVCWDLGDVEYAMPAGNFVEFFSSVAHEWIVLDTDMKVVQRTDRHGELMADRDDQPDLVEHPWIDDLLLHTNRAALVAVTEEGYMSPDAFVETDDGSWRLVSACGVNHLQHMHEAITTAGYEGSLDDGVLHLLNGSEHPFARDAYSASIDQARAALAQAAAVLDQPAPEITWNDLNPRTRSLLDAPSIEDLGLTPVFLQLTLPASWDQRDLGICTRLEIGWGACVPLTLAADGVLRVPSYLHATLETEIILLAEPYLADNSAMLVLGRLPTARDVSDGFLNLTLTTENSARETYERRLSTAVTVDG